jgi:predicted HTH domain antitoxin
MPVRKKTISLSNMLKDHPRVSEEVVARFNQRINERMKVVVRDLQKKQRISLEKASRIILNA